MSIELNQSILASIVTEDSNINQAAATVNQYTEMCKRGEISREEYAELIEDIQRTINIEANVNELQAMERLNTAINGLIMIAKLV